MGTNSGENYHKVGISQLAFKVRGHFCEHLCLTVVCLAYVLVSSCHTFVAAYYNYAHFITSTNSCYMLTKFIIA